MDKIIFLVDMNAFYISCEMSRNSKLKGIPAAVAGNPEKRSGIILAANYKAREYKVKTTMTINTAKNLCPDIVFVPPDHDFYRKRSREVMDILSMYSPTIEKNSIDEAWLDLSGCEDLFGKPLETANKIMNDIIGKLDLWCSIGISYCKFLSKMAADMKKPLGITEIWKKDIESKLWPLKLNLMYGIGKKTEEKLNNLGIFTIGDLATYDRNLIIKKLGKHSSEFHDLANGIDASNVMNNSSCKNKSIGRSTTLPEDIVNIEEAKTIIMKLAEEVGTEARNTDFKGKTISIIMKYSNFHSITRQKTVQSTYLTKDIYLAGYELLDKNWDISKPVRLLGISLSSIKCTELKQISIFDISNNINKIQNFEKYNLEREEKLEKTIDSIREKYGVDKLKRAKLIKKSNKL